jgi:putative peptidoglycan lipid II flippase
MSLFKAMATVAGITGLSRIAGFTRDIIMASILGAGPVADAFFVALKLPNFFRKVTAEGAFSVSFVPLYAEVMEREGKERADIFASRMFSIMFCLLAVLTFIFMIAMPLIIYLIAPGFNEDPERYDMAVDMSLITFPYLFLMSLTALLGGVLNARNKFAPFAFAPVLFNVTLIAALLLSDWFENAGYALSWGVLVAGVIQLIFLYVSTRGAGVHIAFSVPYFSDNAKTVFKRMGPGIIGAGVLQINLFADLIIASFLAEGAISYLYYADRLNQLPLGVIGIAVGTALLPMLSKEMAAQNTAKAKDLFNRALEMCLLLGLPAAVALFVVPHFLVSALFERGAFESADTYYTGYVLMGYAFGLPAYIGVKVLSTTFWAQGDTKTPVNTAIVATIANIIIGLILSRYIGVAGIAVATGIAGWLQYILLNKKLDADLSYDTQFTANFPKIVLSSLVMAACLYGFAVYAIPYIPFEIFNLVLLVVLGMIIYAGCIFAFKVVKISELKQYFRRK